MTKSSDQVFPLLVYTLASCLPHEHAMSTMHNERDRRTQPNDPHWIVDSGATIHCVGDLSLLTHIYTNQPPVHIRVANGQVVTAHAVGSAMVKLIDSKGRKHEITLHNVVFHPSFGNHHLLSVRRLWRHNRISVHFKSTSYLKCANSGTKFPIHFGTNYSTPIVLSANIDMDLLHARFGHASERRVKKMIGRSNNFPKYSPHSMTHDPTSCDACNSGGARRKAFPKHVGNPFTYFGERLSSDLCGPFPKAIGGYKYLLNIVDAATNNLYTYPLRNKSSAEVRSAMEEFMRDNRTHLNHGKPVRWHTDNGGEFMSNDIDEFCEEFAVRRSFSVPYSPPTNAHAERMWSTILRPIRTMLAASHVHESFWPYAAAHATYLHNIMPSSRLAGEMSPYQALHGMKPDVSKVRVWGCTAWYLLPEHEVSSKVSPRALPAVHLGLDPVRKGYIVYIPELNRITTAYHVTFQERKFLTFSPNGVINAPRRVNRLRRNETVYPDTPHPLQPPTRHYPNDHNETHADEHANDHAKSNKQPKCSHPKCFNP